MEGISFREIQFGTADYEAEIELRNEVLRKPLGLDLKAENLDHEKLEFHFGAFENQKLIGVLVLKPLPDGEVKMRQVAVAVDRQGKNVGAGLVMFSEQFSREKGWKAMVLHARKTAIPFYEKLKYQTIGDEFLELGIPHKKMKKDL